MQNSQSNHAMQRTSRGYCPPARAYELQRRFVAAITDPLSPGFCNATASAKIAGYSPRGAGTKGWQLLRRGRVYTAIYDTFNARWGKDWPAEIDWTDRVKVDALHFMSRVLNGKVESEQEIGRRQGFAEAINVAKLAVSVGATANDFQQYEARVKEWIQGPASVAAPQFFGGAA